MPTDSEDTPVLDTLAAMTAASLEQCDLPADALLLVRLAALVAVDARPISYLAHIGARPRDRHDARRRPERPGRGRNRQPVVTAGSCRRERLAVEALVDTTRRDGRADDCRFGSASALIPRCITTEVEAEFATYAAARVREFVPILVETHVHARLRRQLRP